MLGVEDVVADRQVVAAGVGTVVTHTPTRVLNVLTFVESSAFWSTLAGGCSPTPALRRPPRFCAEGRRRRGWMLRGMEVSGLNPKGLLLLAMLPQLTHPRGT